MLDSQAMLLVFPNTFEFFFIAYEGLRTRWDPDRWSGRFWLYVAAGIWVFGKLPQEYWIHVAHLDFTEAVSDHPWFGVLCLLGLAGRGRRAVERAGREVDPADAARGDRRRDPAVGAPDGARCRARRGRARRRGRALSDRGNLPVATGLLFAYLTTLIVVLYDTYRPIRAARDDP